MNFFKPFTVSGMRIVTCHGDLHKENILFNEDKLYLIDFDWSHVGYATSDLAFLIDRNIPKERRDLKKLLLKYYLEYIGDNCSSENIDLFLYDIEC